MVHWSYADLMFYLASYGRDGKCHVKTCSYCCYDVVLGCSGNRERHSAKRLKTGLVGDGFMDKEVHQSEFESEFFKKYVEVSVGSLTKDQLSRITVPVKVRLRSRIPAVAVFDNAESY